MTSLALNALDKRRAEFRDSLRVFAKRANIYHGVVGVIVHIEHGSKNMLYADRFCFAAGDDAHSTGVVRIAGRADAIAHGKFVASSNRIPMPVSASSDISSGIFAISCRAIDHDRCFVDRSTEKDDAADVVVDDLSPQLFKIFAVLVGKFCVEADVNGLSDLFLDGHFLELFVGPFPCFF